MPVLLAAASADASAFQGWGAFTFGAVLGWSVYFLNRYRKEVLVGDLASIVGVIGGAGVLALFPAGTDLFAAYGLGLAAGFFGYLVVLLVLVGRSEVFTVDFLLDGRRPRLAEGEEHPRETDRPMGDGGSGLPPGA